MQEDKLGKIVKFGPIPDMHVLGGRGFIVGFADDSAVLWARIQDDYREIGNAFIVVPVALLEYEGGEISLHYLNVQQEVQF